jgi:hypothetical protein
MLITNFAAGELSEDLFGRTDLDQYFKGAAHIENFKILPNGGVEKRPGTKRFFKVTTDNAGRLIPFIINREIFFILYLVSDSIFIYSSLHFATPINIASIIDGTNVYSMYTKDEISQVQFAQDFNKLILVHPNHPPFLFQYNGGEMPEASLFSINITYDVQTTDIDGTITTVKGSDEDPTYKNAGYLKSANNYPSCVSFMAGRIIFGNTINNKQRLFWSRANDINDFSTFRRYVINSREYITVQGDIQEGRDTIVLGLDEALKFTQNLTSYYVDSTWFPEGTVIRSLQANMLTLSQISRLRKALDTDQQTSLDAWLQKGGEEEDTAQFLEIGQAYADATWYDPVIYAKVGASTLQIKSDDDSFTVDLNYTNYLKYKDDLDGIKTMMQNYGDKLCSEVVSKTHMDFPSGALDNFNNIALYFQTNLKNYCQYPPVSTLTEGTVTIPGGGTLLGNLWYGKPDGGYNNIYSEIMQYTGSAQNAYIPFYVKKQTYQDYPVADDGFTFELASERNDEIKWLLQNKNLIVGTESSEFVISPNITALTQQAIINSRYGSSEIQALSIGDAAVFLFSGKKGIIEYYVPQADNYFRKNDLVRFAKQMLDESVATDFDYTIEPQVRIIVSRQDGKIVILNYDSSLSLLAWERFSFKSNSFAQNIAVLPGTSGYDDIYMLTNVEGQAYFEVYQPQNKDNIFIDSYSPVTSATWSTMITDYNTALAKVVRINGSEIETNPASSQPDWTQPGNFYIGYAFTASLRTMPIIVNKDLGKQRIVHIALRFLKSYMPTVKSIENGNEKGIQNIFFQPDESAPFSGVKKIPFPGNRAFDTQLEIVNSDPVPVKILAINSEAI